MHSRGVLCVTQKTQFYRSQSEHVGLKVLVQKLNTTHLGQQNYQWTAPNYSNSYEYRLYSDFYTLYPHNYHYYYYYYYYHDEKILHFGAEWEARGSWSWKPGSDITNDFLPNSKRIIVFSHFFYYYQGHFLSHYERLKYFTCIAVFIVKKMETFHILLFFSPDSAIASIPLYCFHFSSPACSNNH